MYFADDTLKPQSIANASDRYIHATPRMIAPNVSMEYFTTYAVLVLHLIKISGPLVDENEGFFITVSVFKSGVST